KKIMTCWIAVIDSEKQLMTLSNGGHNEAFLVRSGKTLVLEFPGPVVGVGPRGKYENVEFQIFPGDILILYTDGLIEAIAKDGNMIGSERLQNALPLIVKETPRETENEIRAWHQKLAQVGPQADDITILAVQLATFSKYKKKQKKEAINCICKISP
ncbi:serine/threonine-protein phosphatase, partial [bacterium]|nr:serine/threonine-protein phosphatase [bacterium]